MAVMGLKPPVELTKGERNSIFEANQRTSPLLRLPAEIRNKIYELAFRSNAIRVTDSPPQLHRRRLGDPAPPSKALALLHTCRQIPYEALRLFFTCTTFELDDETDIQHLLQHVGGEKRNLITAVRISPYMSRHIAGVISPRWIFWKPPHRMYGLRGLKTVYVPCTSTLFGKYDGTREYVMERIRGCFGMQDLEVVFEDGWE